MSNVRLYLRAILVGDYHHFNPHFVFLIVTFLAFLKIVKI